MVFHQADGDLGICRRIAQEADGVLDLEGMLLMTVKAHHLLLPLPPASSQPRHCCAPSSMPHQ
jgi:hypothetical protein